jgi:hypothetical protein
MLPVEFNTIPPPGVAMVLECLSPGKLLDPAPDDLSDGSPMPAARLLARSSIDGPAETEAAVTAAAAAAAVAVARVMVTAAAVEGETTESADVMT